MENKRRNAFDAAFKLNGNDANQKALCYEGFNWISYSYNRKDKTAGIVLPHFQRMKRKAGTRVHQKTLILTQG